MAPDLAAVACRNVMDECIQQPATTSCAANHATHLQFPPMAETRRPTFADGTQRHRLCASNAHAQLCRRRDHHRTAGHYHRRQRHLGNPTGRVCGLDSCNLFGQAFRLGQSHRRNHLDTPQQRCKACKLPNFICHRWFGGHLQRSYHHQLFSRRYSDEFIPQRRNHQPGIAHR